MKNRVSPWKNQYFLKVGVPKILKKSTTNRCKMGGQKRPREKRREIDTVGRNVLKKVAKGQPKGSQMESKAPKWSPRGSQDGAKKEKENEVKLREV